MAVRNTAETIPALAAHAPRPYEFVILSDHGQSQGATFRQRYGTPLEEVVRDLMAGAGSPTTDSIAATGTEEARTPVSRFLAEVRQQHGMVGMLSRSKLAAVVEEEPGAARPEAAQGGAAQAGAARHSGDGADAAEGALGHTRGHPRAHPRARGYPRHRPRRAGVRGPGGGARWQNTASDPR